MDCFNPGETDDDSQPLCEAGRMMSDWCIRPCEVSCQGVSGETKLPELLMSGIAGVVRTDVERWSAWTRIMEAAGLE